MFEAITTALAQLADPAMLLYLFAGVVVGIIIGVIPGLGGTGAVAVLMPFVFVLEPNQAIAMIIGAVAVVHTSDVITSVVLGIPGSAAASVFLLDGHEMAKKGEGGRALSVSFLSSMIGGLIGIVALTVVVPIAKPIVSTFGSPEIFSLIVAGVFLTAMLSKGNMAKGLMISVFGLALGLIGVSPTSAEYRFTFGSEYLTEGLGLVAVALGIFGLAEIIDLVAKKASVADAKIELGGGWKEGAKDILRYPLDVIRGSAVGVGVGFLPGVGSTAGSWLSYGQAQAFASKKGNSRFGKGDPRGVIAPSAASNGIESGALIPTLLFGVPGAAPFALLLGVLLIFGIQPGPNMVTKHLDLVYFMVWSFAIASVVGAALAFLLARPLAKLSFVSFPLLAATLIPILFMSGFQDSYNLNVFYVMLGLGIVGWICKVCNIPRAPFLIAFVLAEPLERYFFLTVKAFSPSEWLTRPFVIVVIIILVGVLAVPWAQKRFGRTIHHEQSEAADKAEGLGAPPTIRLAISGVFFLFFLVQLLLSSQYSGNGSLFPYAVGSVGLALSVIAIVEDILKIRTLSVSETQKREWRETVITVAKSLLWVLAFVWLVFAFGLYVGTGIFAIAFLITIAQLKLWKTAVYVSILLGCLWALENWAYLIAPVGYLQI
ncbi:tripartite tricarboxylate transporter permease [Corynebacterium sp. HMSC068G04]|uniref:tripartite tricarboxylate transporter permease n=1 Tax=Corynebacterium sp. HMSC068G04 TaxID=1739497 RepID=UPI0008A5C13C|nr:tripartite tricarboxylate transporter permease [Corynebacterium sp. HMSC068G04]OFP26351.1 hypothetical protein HMPREF2993_04230 [Corynebacterium sp. HMSC068G04]